MQCPVGRSWVGTGTVGGPCPERWPPRGWVCVWKSSPRVMSTWGQSCALGTSAQVCGAQGDGPRGSASEAHRQRHLGLGLAQRVTGSSAVHGARGPLHPHMSLWVPVVTSDRLGTEDALPHMAPTGRVSGGIPTEAWAEREPLLLARNLDLATYVHQGCACSLVLVVPEEHAGPGGPEAWASSLL